MFEANAVARLTADKDAIVVRHAGLLDAYLGRKFKNPRAMEHAKHGFLRRLKTLTRCIDAIFEIVPPDSDASPDGQELTDLAIVLQAFVMNVFGSVDNLAWVWVWEKDVRRDDGSTIPNAWIGLRRRHKVVRRSFSAEFVKHLDEVVEPRLSDLEDFRDAVAHRIPLYVPPHVVRERNIQRYKELDEERLKVLFQEGEDSDEFARLSAEQDAIAEFWPVMTHSFEEGALQIPFHGQVLADFETIHDLAWRMLEELDRPKAA